MSPPLKKKQLGEVNRIHKKRGKRRMSLFSWAGPEREKKVGGGSRKSAGNKAGECATCESKSHSLKA